MKGFTVLDRHQLFDYQTLVIEEFKKRKKIGMFLDMGLGKTIIALTALQDLRSAYEITRTLIVTTKRIAQTVYEEELESWSHLYMSANIAVGTPKQRRTAVETNSDILVINFDNIKWLQENYPKLDFSALIIDESSAIRNPSSNRFKHLKTYTEQVEYCAILTGTPTPNGYHGLWSQIYFLDVGLRLGKNITEFRRRFCSRDYSGFNFVVNKNQRKDIDYLISDLCISMKSEDYLNLPPLERSTIQGKLPLKHQQDYATLEKDFLLEFGGDERLDIVAVNKAILGNKLLQFCSGAVYAEDRTVIDIHDEKLRMLWLYMNAHPNQQFIIAFNYQHEIMRILKHFPRAVMMDKHSKNVKKWNDGKIDMLCLHPASASHGLNLQKNPKGNTIIWFGYTNNLEYYQQLNKRIHRTGKTQTCKIVHLSLGKIEHDLMKRLGEKADDQDGLMDALKC